jgi:hypothetical protein
MEQKALRLHGGSTTSCIVDLYRFALTARCLRTYRVDFAARMRCNVARAPIFVGFLAVDATSEKFIATRKPCNRRMALRLHPIRAETLFTNSACLPFQIFIPYAPISRSAGYGESRPKNCRRHREKLMEKRGSQVSVAVMRSRPMGEFGAHAARLERVVTDHFERSEPMQDIFRNLRQVVGVESIHSGDQHINLGDTT